MRIIFEPTALAKGICGEAQFKSGMNYRMTKHCLQIPCEDGTLLFHTLTGALVLLGEDEQLSDSASQLVPLRFLVPIDWNEIKFACDARYILTLTEPQKVEVTGFTVFPTTDCNARCYYCYEKGIRHLTMTEQTARDTAEYIQRVSGGKSVKIRWFGGEPLVNHRAISVICRQLEDSGVLFSSKMTTNGYLFDRSLISTARKLWRLSSAHITVDGTKEIYLKTKAYANGDTGAYERVLTNIEALLAEGIKVSVRLNVNRRNYDDVNELSLYLASRFSGKEGFSVVPVFLKDFAGEVYPFENEDLAAERFLALEKKLAGLGLNHEYDLSRKMKCRRCMADSDSCEVIYPDGTVGKCEHYDKNEVIGSIYDSVRDQELIESWKERITDDPACADCPLFPRCIELVKCPWAKDGCPRSVKLIRIEKLKESVLEAYRKQKQSG